MDVVGENAVFEWGYSPLLLERNQFVDHGMLLVIKNIRLFTGANWMPDVYNIQRERPRDISEHQRLLCRDMKFGKVNNICHFPSHYLDNTRATADPRVFYAIKESCEQALQNLRAQMTFVEQVRKSIFGLLPVGEATLQRVADSLSMGDRTLQRRLADFTTTFDVILEEVRREISEKLLPRHDVTIEEISKRCGYSSTAAYSRAVRGWYGKPPIQLRKQI